MFCESWLSFELDWIILSWRLSFCLDGWVFSFFSSCEAPVSNLQFFRFSKNCICLLPFALGNSFSTHLSVKDILMLFEWKSVSCSCTKQIANDPNSGCVNLYICHWDQFDEISETSSLMVFCVRTIFLDIVLWTWANQWQLFVPFRQALCYFGHLGHSHIQTVPIRVVQ